MDAKTVRKLERELEHAIGEVVTRIGRGNLPIAPSQQTMHLMAKAAVAVYEAAVERESPTS